jgi:hypothetical protein
VTTLDAGLAVRAFFTTRAGGVSEGDFSSLNVSYSVGDDPENVAENRRVVERIAGTPVAYMTQVHGADAAAVTDSEDSPQADAIVTATPGLALAVAVADCVPILAHDRASGAVAAIHAGRRGVASGVVGSAVARMREVAGRAIQIEASIGPAICGACYEVPAAMREEVAAIVPEARAETSWGTPALDLVAGVTAQLHAAGVRDIVLAGACTRESPECYSHRRDGVTGRFAGVIVCGHRD